MWSKFQVFCRSFSNQCSVSPEKMLSSSMTAIFPVEGVFFVPGVYQAQVHTLPMAVPVFDGHHAASNMVISG